MISRTPDQHRHYDARLKWELDENTRIQTAFEEGEDRGEARLRIGLIRTRGHEAVEARDRLARDFYGACASLRRRRSTRKQPMLTQRRRGAEKNRPDIR